jgi:hypothetical protein
MELEYINLQEFLLRNASLKIGDYLYRHDKNEYPLKNEHNISNLFFVTKGNGHKLTIHNIASSNIEQVDLNVTTEFWWILPLPDSIRKKIGLE